jgi:hypothetical protein
MHGSVLKWKSYVAQSAYSPRSYALRRSSRGELAGVRSDRRRGSRNSRRICEGPRIRSQGHCRRSTVPTETASGARRFAAAEAREQVGDFVAISSTTDAGVALDVGPSPKLGTRTAKIIKEEPPRGVIVASRLSAQPAGAQVMKGAASVHASMFDAGVGAVVTGGWVRSHAVEDPLADGACEVSMLPEAGSSVAPGRRGVVRGMGVTLTYASPDPLRFALNFLCSCSQCNCTSTGFTGLTDQV